jgi:hypothetical protein
MGLQEGIRLIPGTSLCGAVAQNPLRTILSLMRMGQ